MLSYAQIGRVSCPPHGSHSADVWQELRRTLMRTPGLLHLKQVEQLLLSHHMLGAVLAACNAPGQIVRW